MRNGFKMEIISAHYIILSIILVLTAAFAFFPFVFISRLRSEHDVARRRRYARVISLMSCFSGGVFLGTCLLDLFPDVQEEIEEVLDDLKVSTKFPIAEFLVVIGFFLVLITEQIALDYQGVGKKEERTPLLHNHAHRDYQTYSSMEDTRVTSTVRDRSLGTEDDGLLSEDQLEEHEHSIHQDPASHSSLRALLLLAALSVHSVFEGLAIGLESKVDTVMQIFVAVILHKCVVAFSLSMNLVQSHLSKWAIMRLLVLFCLASPIGVGIGMGVLEVENDVGAGIATSVLQGLACGTFLYVTFFEVLPHELQMPDGRMLKLFFTILGFSTSCGILLLDAQARGFQMNAN
ncbi:zinc transporter ZIP1-like [Artemia franciscana]